jgi:hypothetical protein
MWLLQYAKFIGIIVRNNPAGAGRARVERPFEHNKHRAGLKKGKDDQNEKKDSWDFSGYSCDCGRNGGLRARAGSDHWDGDHGGGH